MFGNCSCPYYADLETPEFFNERWVKAAKKDHQCIECFCTIKQGSSYRYVSWKYDGAFYIAKICSRCDQIADDFFPNCPLPFGYLWQELWESFAVEGEDNSWLEVPNDE